MSENLRLSPRCGSSSTLEGNSLSRDEQIAKLRRAIQRGAVPAWPVPASRSSRATW